MARIWIKRGVWMVLVVVSGLGGYAVGTRQWFNWGISMMQVEAAGNLSQRVETLSRLQMGDVQGAVAELETQADTLTLGIAHNRGADKRVLSVMKTYLSLVPPSPKRARTLEPALQDLPILHAGQCADALSQLMRSRTTSDATSRR